MKSGFSFEFYEKVYENCFIHISNYVNGNLQLSLFGVDPDTEEMRNFTDITLDQNSWEISKNDIVVDCLYNTSFVPQLKELGILKEQTGICPVNNSIYPVYSLNFDKIKELSYEIENLVVA